MYVAMAYTIFVNRNKDVEDVWNEAPIEKKNRYLQVANPLIGVTTPVITT